MMIKRGQTGIYWPKNNQTVQMQKILRLVTTILCTFGACYLQVWTWSRSSTLHFVYFLLTRIRVVEFRMNLKIGWNFGWWKSIWTVHFLCTPKLTTGSFRFILESTDSLEKITKVYLDQIRTFAANRSLLHLSLELAVENNPIHDKKSTLQE